MLKNIQIISRTIGGKAYFDDYIDPRILQKAEQLQN